MRATEDSPVLFSNTEARFFRSKLLDLLEQGKMRLEMEFPECLIWEGSSSGTLPVSAYKLSHLQCIGEN